MKFRSLYESIKEPTFAQIKSGNYYKRKLNWNGLQIAIENEAGSIRQGYDENGNKTWHQKMKDAYGYIKKTVGPDNDHLDVFLGPKENSNLIFVINQIDQKSGEFDEHKIILMTDSEDEAKKIYLRNYEKGWKIGPIVTMDLPQFKKWIFKESTQFPAKDFNGKGNTNIYKFSYKDRINY